MLLQFATLFGSLLCFAGGVAAFIIWRRQHGALEMQDRLVALTQAGPAIAPVAARNILPEVEKVLPLMLRRRLFQAGIHINPTRLSLMAFVLAFLWVVVVSVSGIFVAILIDGVIVLVSFAIIDQLASRRLKRFR